MTEVRNILFDARPQATGFSRESLFAEISRQLADDEEFHVLLCGDAPKALPKIVWHCAEGEFGSSKCRSQALKIAKKIKPDVFIATSLLASTHFCRRTVILQSSSLDESNGFFKHLRASRSVFHAKRILCTSRHILSKLEKSFGRRVASIGETIPPGIPAQYLPVQDEEVAEIRERRNLPEKFILYLGDDGDSANVSTLLAAYALLDPTTTIPLVLAGFPKDSRAVRQLAEKFELTDRIILLGEIAETERPALLCAAHALVFPSLDESKCHPVLEAMACGTPVVCSALGILKEWTGGAAKFVHPTDRQEWKTALHSSLVSIDWRDAVRLEGLSRASDFSASKHAAAILEVCRRFQPKRNK